MQVIKKNLKESRDRWKSYADWNRCSRVSTLGKMCTFLSNQRRAPYGLDHVPRWHRCFVDPLVLLRGLGQ